MVEVDIVTHSLPKPGSADWPTNRTQQGYEQLRNQRTVGGVSRLCDCCLLLYNSRIEATQSFNAGIFQERGEICSERVVMEFADGNLGRSTGEIPQ